MDWLKGQTVKKKKKNQTEKGNKGELKRKGRKKRKGTKNLGNQLLMGLGKGNQWKPAEGCVSVERC